MEIITRKPQLFLLHFAGGNRYSFDFMRPYLQEMDFIPVELPGRGKRIHEQLLNDFNDAADDLCRQVINGLKTPNFILYGHSLGAMMALKLAGLLEAMNQPPIHIVVSGNSGPGIRDHSREGYLSKEDLKEELKRQGGFSFDFLKMDDLFDFFEPILRADFRLAKWDPISAIRMVNVPIYALAGSNEDAARHIDNWKKFTSSCFAAEILPGDHFFIRHHPQRIAEIIISCSN